MTPNAMDKVQRLSDAELDAMAQEQQGISGDFTQGLRSGALDARASLNKVAGTALNAAGLDGSGRNAASDADRAAAAEEGRGLVQLDDVDGLRSGARWAAGGIGRSLPASAAAIGAGVLTRGKSIGANVLGGTAAMAPLELGDQITRQEADPANAGMSPGDHLRSAALPAVGAAAVQSIIPATVAAKMKGAGAGLSLRQIGTHAALDAPAEGLAEAAGEGIRQVGLNALNPNAGYDVDAIKHAGIEGAALGGAMGAAGGVADVAHKYAGAAVAAPGKAIDAAKALVPDNIKQGLGGAVGAVGEAAGAAKDTVTDAATDVDVPGRMRALHKSFKDKAGAMMDKLADGTETADPEALNAAGDDIGAQRKVFDEADKSAFGKVKQWADELATEELGPEKAAQLKAAVTNLSDKVNQQTVATLRRGQDASKRVGEAISKFHKAVVAKADEQTGSKSGTKKSEDYSGSRKAISDAVRDVLGDDHPVFEKTEYINLLADGLRPFIARVASGKPIDSVDKLDHLSALYDVLEDQTGAVLKAVHTAVSGASKDEKSLFTALNQIEAIRAGKQGVLETLTKNLRPELQGAVRTDELKQEAEMLEAWARSKSDDPAQAEKMKFNDAQIKTALDHRYGAKSEVVMKAVEANIKRERNMIDGESKTQASGESDDAGVEKRSAGEVIGEDPKDKGGREIDPAEEKNKDVRYFPEKGQLYLNPDHARDDPAYAKFGSPADQRMNRAKKENPNAVVKFRKASEIGLDDERVVAKHADLMDEFSTDNPKATDAQARAWADKHIDRFGMVSAESSKNETTMTSDELDSLRLDAKKFGDSKARIDAGKGTILDATRMTIFMARKLKGSYTASDDRGALHRDARMFVEAVAAVTDQLGHSFTVGDNVEITRGKNPLTWGEAQVLLKSDAKSTAGSAKIADRVARLTERRERMIYDEAEGGIDELKASGVRLTKANVRAVYEKARENLAPELKVLDDGIFKLMRENVEDTGPGRQGNDEAGFEGKVQRGLTLNKVRMREIEADLSKLDNSTAAGRAKESELMEEFGRLSIDRNFTVDKTEPTLGTGRSEIDPFGPTVDTLRGKDDPKAEIRTNSDGNARADTVMGRRRAATSVEGPTRPKAPAAKKAAFVEKARSGDAGLLKFLEESDDAMGLQRAAAALQGERGANADDAVATINGRLVELVQDDGVAYGMQTTKYSLLSTEVHEGLGRRGFAAAHDSPVKHEGKFDWRQHSGTGEGQMVKGAGTYLSTGEQGHRYYKALFTNDKGEVTPTYHVSVDIEPTRLLNWDAPVSEQSATVRLRALKAIKDEGLDIRPDDRGEDLYRALSEKLGSDTAASDYMQALGILGHSMRGGKSLEFPHYVIYDDSRINTNYVHFSQQSASPTTAGPAMADRKAVLDYVGKVLGPNVSVAWANILHAGEFDRSAIGDVIRLSVHNLNPMSVAYHEALHGFMARLRDAKQGDIAAVLEKAGNSAPVLNQLKKLLANEPGALGQLTDPEERAAYMYQFWAQGKLTLGPNATSVFERIAEFLRKITGLMTNDEHAVKIMEYFHTGEYEAKRSDPNAVYTALMESGGAGAVAKLKAMTKPLQEIGEALANAGGARLRDTGIPALRELADGMKLKHTTEGGDPGFLPAARAERSRFMNDLGRDLKPYGKDVLAEALEQLQTGVKAPTLAGRTAAKFVGKRLADALTYMQDAGVNITNLADKSGVSYFPRSWDASYISSHQRQFLAMLDKYVASGQLKGDPKVLMQKLMVTDGAEFGVEVDKPGMQHAKERVLSFIDHADAAQFMRKDLYQIMNSYATQATRRAEWSRRFGDDGKGVRTLLEQAEKQGATKDQLDTARKFVRAVDGTLGDTINPSARRMMGNMIVYQNIRLLPLAIFSSAVDAQGIIVRGGTAGEAFKTLTRGFKEIVKNFQKDPKGDHMTHLAEALGVVDSAMLTHTLGASYSQGMVGDKGRAINDWFFRANLMEQYNTSMRVGATEAAMSFLVRHATQPGQHSVRFLRELGLDAADVQVNAVGQPKLLESEGLTLEHAAKMKAAINRWVDGAILRPDAVDKPVWMSDPHYALVAHLKQFVFSFQETILKRVVHEAKNGNYAPGMALASYVPMMIAADMLKGLIQGGGELPDWKKNWGASDYAWSGMERAGLFGVGQFGIDALGGAKNNGAWGAIGSLSGPTLEQIGDAAQVMGGREHFNKFAVKSLPANALYAEALKAEPAESKFAE